MVSKVIFVGRATAETTPGWQDWAVVSITEPGFPGEAKLLPGWHSVCRVHFHDVDPAIPCGEPHTLMNEQDALKITQFIREVAPGVDGVLVHCKAGISRSAAVAKWIAKQFDVPFNHDYDRYNKYVYDMLVKADKQRLKPVFTLAGGDDIEILDTHIPNETGRTITDWSLIKLEASGKLHLVGMHKGQAWVSSPVIKIDLDCGVLLTDSGLCVELDKKSGYPDPEQLKAIERYSKDCTQAKQDYLGSRDD